MRILKEKLGLVLEVIDTLIKERVHRLILSFVFIVSIFGSLAYYFEAKNPEALIRSVWDGIWWGIVTITTVGYGDKYPLTWAGKLMGVVIMGSGVILTIIISGTIASVLVERKMKEGRGLQKVNMTDHIIICGWNQSGNRILNDIQALTNKTKEKIDIALINELETEVFNELQFTYSTKLLTIDVVRGNYTQEQVLDKANIRKAKAVMILADQSGENTLQNADERSVLAAYTITNLNPGARTSVELINPQNEQHLKRTNVDSIIINGEYNSFLMVNAVLYPGVPQAVKEIMNFDFVNDITIRPIPPHYIGKTFNDLFNHFRERDHSILFGIISETKKLSIENFLSEDPSSIDEFIKRKFAESEKDYFADTGGKRSVMINPGWNYVIGETDRAIVIGEVKSTK